MIGTAANATIAATMTWDSLPNGWTLLGQGCYRTAFLAPDGFVYKVQHYSEDDEITENALEALNFSKNDAIVSRSKGRCRLAESTYYPKHNVIAMEYVECAEVAYVSSDGFWSEPTDKALELVQAFSTNDLFDLGEMNVWFDKNGILTMIDYVG